MSIIYNYYKPNSSNQEYFLCISPGGEVKCILHIREGECEGSIKSFLENRSLWEKVWASSQFQQQRKDEKKQETKSDKTSNSNPTLLIPSYGYHSACYKTSLEFLNQKVSQKLVPDLQKFQLDQKIHLQCYHLQLEYYLLYVYFVIKEGKKIGGSWTEPGKNEKHETEIAIPSKAKMLNDESMILKIRNYNFRVGPNFVAKEVHYYHECKRNYLHKKYEPTNIKHSALERLLSYVRKKIIAEKKPKLAFFY